MCQAKSKKMVEKQCVGRLFTCRSQRPPLSGMAHISVTNLAGWKSRRNAHQSEDELPSWRRCWIERKWNVFGATARARARDNGPKWKVVVKSKYTHHFQVNSTKHTTRRTNYECFMFHTPCQMSVWAGHHHRAIGGRLRRIFTWTPPAKQWQPCSPTLSLSNPKSGGEAWPRARYISQIKYVSQQSTPIRQLTKNKALFNKHLKAIVWRKCCGIIERQGFLGKSMKLKLPHSFF